MPTRINVNNDGQSGRVDRPIRKDGYGHDHYFEHGNSNNSGSSRGTLNEQAVNNPVPGKGGKNK